MHVVARRLSIATSQWLVVLLGAWVLSAWFTWWVADEDITTYMAAGIYVLVAPVLLWRAMGGPARGRWVAVALLVLIVGPTALLLVTFETGPQAVGLGLALLAPVSALHVAVSRQSPSARRFCIAAMLVFMSSCTSLPYRVWPWTEIRREAAAALVEHQRARVSMGMPPTGELSDAQWQAFRARPGRWPERWHPMFALLPYAVDAQDEYTALLSYGDRRASRMHAPDFMGPFHTYD